MKILCRNSFERMQITIWCGDSFQYCLWAVRFAIFLTTFLSLAFSEACAEKITNRVAFFSGIDKITGRISSFDAYIGETVQFGSLQVTPRVCYSRPSTEKQKITSFLEVDEITLDRSIQRIFTGWMFADSPGLNAIDHSVYDIWLVNCKMSSEVTPPETR